MNSDGKDVVFASPVNRKNDFQFNHQVAEVFDDMADRSVPFYAEIQKAVVELVANFGQAGTRIYDLGCATGNTLISLAKVIDDETISFVGIDNSRFMLEKAKSKLLSQDVLNRCHLIE